MAAKKNTQKGSNNSFKEFEFKGKTFTYSGRLYPENKREAGKLTITPMSLTLNGVFTIKGCSFMETKDNMWVSGPSYKSGDEYKDYLYIDKALNEDMDALANAISDVLESK